MTRTIGTKIYEVPPEHGAQHDHCHPANQESIYTLEGLGTLLTGEGELGFLEGEYVTLPKGAGACRLINISEGGSDICTSPHGEAGC
jgi:uncharacterized cupin superfamily protein